MIPCNATFSLIIVRLEICKAPTLQIKAMNKHSISHIMSIEMEIVINNKNLYKKEKKKKKLTHNVDKGSSVKFKRNYAIPARTHTHTRTHAHTHARTHARMHAQSPQTE